MANLKRSLRRRPAQIAAAALALALLLAAAAQPPAPATAPAPRDWHAFPAILQLHTDQDVYALGDIHADYDKAAKLLVGAGLLAKIPASPADAQWSGGKCVLVCTGDMIDKWNHSLEVLQLMQALQTSAAQRGGQVIVTLGNHEAEFLAFAGDDKKAAEFGNELLAKGIQPADVAAGKDRLGIGQWLRTRPIAAKVNDSFFCHAGNTFGATLAQLEASIQTGVDKDGFAAAVLSEPNSILEAKLAPVPWWMRTPATQTATPPGAAPGESAGPAALKKYVAALGCTRMVMGHQPGKINFGGGIERKAGEPFAYEGLLFLIDVGMSQGVQNSPGIVLKIHHGAGKGIGAMDETGKETLLWPRP